MRTAQLGALLLALALSAARRDGEVESDVVIESSTRL